MTDTQLALVTGASSGIGFELARLFADNGYDLVVAADGDGINEVPGRLADTAADVHPVQVNLRTPEGVEHLYASTIADGRELSVAALNAGIGRGGLFLETDLDDDLSIVDLNVRSTVHRAEMEQTPMGKMPKDDPADVARQGFEALMRGDKKVVAASPLSKIMGTVNRVLPDNVKAAGNRVLSAPLRR